jgi:uncharacterized repeat protein (TIGR03803 family)
MTNRNPNCSSARRLRAVSLVPALTVVLSVLVTVPAAQAQTYTILHNFGLRQGDPLAPTSLILDKSGKLYGTTGAGGNRGDGEGTVFKMNPTTGKLTVLYNFGGGPGDGDGPIGLLRDAAGNFYGTTEGGGASYSGTVFKLDANGTETVLHSFGRGGRDPLAGVIRDPEGNLYGTASIGGNPACNGGCGVVFKVDSSGKESLVHGFTGSPDGRFPAAGLIRDRTGNLYGTTVFGGGGKCTSGCGTVFKIGPKGFETVLYRFTMATDGLYPSGGLIRDGAGNLYGTASGGDPTCDCGVIFRLDKGGNEAVLYSFKGGSDGANPVGTLVRDSVGNLYGVTQNGGNPNGQGVGTVFKLDTNGVETVLHSFAGFPTDGALPFVGLVRDSAGNLYGITVEGGTNNGGIAFKLTP